jgi:Lar family restriction alleviation protein
MAELKPLDCPFCNHNGALYVEQETEEQWFVMCCDCGAAGPYAQTKEQAISAWNKRSK